MRRKEIMKTVKTWLSSVLVVVAQVLSSGSEAVDKKLNVDIVPYPVAHIADGAAHSVFVILAWHTSIHTFRLGSLLFEVDDAANLFHTLRVRVIRKEWKEWDVEESAELFPVPVFLYLFDQTSLGIFLGREGEEIKHGQILVLYLNVETLKGTEGTVRISASGKRMQTPNAPVPPEYLTEFLPFASGPNGEVPVELHTDLGRTSTLRVYKVRTYDLVFPVAAGQRYAIEYSADLVSWSLAEVLTAEEDIVTLRWSIPTPGVEKQYIRLMPREEPVVP